MYIYTLNNYITASLVKMLFITINSSLTHHAAPLYYYWDLTCSGPVQECVLIAVVVVMLLPVTLTTLTL